MTSNESTYTNALTSYSLSNTCENFYLSTDSGEEIHNNGQPQSNSTTTINKTKQRKSEPTGLLRKSVSLSSLVLKINVVLSLLVEFSILRQPHWKLLTKRSTYRVYRRYSVYLSSEYTRIFSKFIGLYQHLLCCRYNYVPM